MFDSGDYVILANAAYNPRPATLQNLHVGDQQVVGGYYPDMGDVEYNFSGILTITALTPRERSRLASDMRAETDRCLEIVAQFEVTAAKIQEWDRTWRPATAAEIAALRTRHGQPLRFWAVHKADAIAASRGARHQRAA